MDVFMVLTPETMRVVWLIVFIVLMIVELITVGLTTIWFAGGALAAFVLTFTGAGAGWQIALFLAVSIVLLVFTRPWAMKYVNRNREKTNYEGVIGQTVRITERVSNGQSTGKAMLGGQEWTVRAEKEDQVFEAGSRAVVTAVQGVKLIVRKKEEK